MTGKKKPFNFYEQSEHELETAMLKASSLPTEEAHKRFVTETFVLLNQSYQLHQMNKTAYLRLVNRLAAFDGGRYNDYLDLLVGSATMGMLNDTLAQGKNADLAALACTRREEVTRITGMSPITPEQEEEPS
jgi:hypothetical protein